MRRTLEGAFASLPSKLQIVATEAAPVPRTSVYGLAPLDPHAVAERQEEEEEEEEAVKEFFANLPERDRILLGRIFINGGRQAALARELGVSRAAVTQRLQRIYRDGREALRLLGNR